MTYESNSSGRIILFGEKKMFFHPIFTTSKDKSWYMRVMTSRAERKHYDACFHILIYQSSTKQRPSVAGGDIRGTNRGGGTAHNQRKISELLTKHLKSACIIFDKKHFTHLANSREKVEMMPGIIFDVCVIRFY